MEKKTKSIKIPVVLLLLIAIAVVVIVLFIYKKTKDSKVGQESPYKNDESNIQLNNIVNNTIDDNSTGCIKSEDIGNYTIEVYSDSTINLYYRANGTESRLVNVFDSKLPLELLGKEEYEYGYKVNSDGNKNLELIITVYNPEEKKLTPEIHYYNADGYEYYFDDEGVIQYYNQ